MKLNHARWAALFLLMAGTQVSASDRELCQGGYPVMLMTDTECRIYLATRTALQKSGDTVAAQLLDAHIRDQLAERAEACPCAMANPSRLVLSQNDGC
jgi:hypothetical protein